MQNSRTYKIVIVGDGGVGKTSWLNRLLTGNFEKKYDPTIGAAVQNLTFRTNYGCVTLQCWDTAGQEEYEGLKDGYFIGAEGAIAIFDITKRPTRQNIKFWREYVFRITEKVPFVMVANKTDLPIVDQRATNHFRGQKWIEMSVKSGLNMERPFLELVRKLVGQKDLVFVEPMVE